MKFTPILFSTEMVQAILAGRKTQTRRILKVKGCKPFIPDSSWDIESILEWNKNYHPYGQVGDVLWVRESFNVVTEKFPEEKKVFVYKETMVSKNRAASTEWKWKPSIHMPKEACRIFLQIKDIRIERLNDIKEKDAISEGIKMTWISDNPRQCKFKNYLNNGSGSTYPVESFRSLWHKINGPTSWVKNPWVWVIEFERIEKPENF